MNLDLWTPGEPSATSLIGASRALLQQTLQSLATRGTAMERENNKKKLVLEYKNAKVRRMGDTVLLVRERLLQRGN
jgi:hypothetical protein